MQYTGFGRTGLRVSRTGFGGIPIQRIPYEESTALLRRAYDAGVTLYDTANGYTTSEERIGLALGDRRHDIVLCTKSPALPPEKLTANLENSLKMLKTDYLDVLQVHNPPFVPRPGGEDGVYDTLVKAKAQGKLRHIGITQHSLKLAVEAVESGLYDTMQYPLSYLSGEDELALIALCQAKDVGLLAMKAMAGGLLRNGRAAFAFLRRYENVLPIWGIQRGEELEEFLACEENPPALDGALQAVIDADRAELSGSFCRSCGYCLPCPAGIAIPQAARITLLMRRAVYAHWTTPEWQANMRRIDGCTACGHCKAHCPYGLDTPELLKRQRDEYFALLEG
jgi:aryl-alcohol dehydrogenase-like predicted oxidoreductase